jgi:hypothetical protein
MRRLTFAGEIQMTTESRTCGHEVPFSHQRHCEQCRAVADSYRAAIRQIAATLGAGEIWTTSITIYRYACGACEVFFQDWGIYERRGRENWERVIEMTPEREAAFNAAIESANAALRIASGKLDDEVRSYGWYHPKGTLAQTQHDRRIAAKARKRKGIARVRAEINRLHDEEGMKWEMAVAWALKRSRLPRAVKDDIAEGGDWETWIEAYA